MRIRQRVLQVAFTKSDTDGEVTFEEASQSVNQRVERTLGVETGSFQTSPAVSKVRKSRMA
jgi:hypothetical protein